MKVAVTGASGLIGANVLSAAAARGHHAIGLARSTSRCEVADALGIPIIRADVLEDSGVLVSALEGCDALIHTAASFSYQRDAQSLHDVAVRGTQSVLTAAAQAGVKRVVVTSSSVVFGHSPDPEPISELAGITDPAGEPPYVAAKIAQDQAALALARKLGLDLMLTCPAMSIGPTASALGPSNGLILAYLADQTRSTYPGGCNLVAAADVADAHLLLAEHGTPGEHYLLGSGNLTWSAIHAEIGRLTGTGGPRWEISPSFAQIAAGAEEWTARLTRRPALTTRHQAAMLGRYYWYDDAKARALGYAPRPAMQALAEAISWLVASPHVSRELRAQIRLADDIHRLRYTEAAA